MSSNSSKQYFDGATDPGVATHRENIKKIVSQFVRKVRDGPEVKISKYGFSHTLNQGDFDEMEEGFNQWIANLDWRDIETMSDAVRGLSW